MSASARGIPATDRVGTGNMRSNGAAPATRSELESRPRADAAVAQGAKLTVFVAADNRLLREALGRMLAKKGEIEVCGMESHGPLQAEQVAQANAKVLLMTSRGALNDDLQMIQEVRAAAPGVRVLLLGTVRNEAEFLQCVRAGISGYLLHDASSEEVLEGVRAVHAGEAVCPGILCTALFRYFESEAASLPCASAGRRLGLTRREQQLIPLIAKGLTNKEIANHFSLSEQTVKNHVHNIFDKLKVHRRGEAAACLRTALRRTHPPLPDRARQGAEITPRGAGS